MTMEIQSNDRSTNDRSANDRSANDRSANYLGYLGLTIYLYGGIFILSKFLSPFLYHLHLFLFYHYMDTSMGDFYSALSSSSTVLGSVFNNILIISFIIIIIAIIKAMKAMKDKSNSKFKIVILIFILGYVLELLPIILPTVYLNIQILPGVLSLKKIFIVCGWVLYCVGFVYLAQGIQDLRKSKPEEVSNTQSIKYSNTQSNNYSNTQILEVRKGIILIVIGYAIQAFSILLNVLLSYLSFIGIITGILALLSLYTFIYIEVVVFIFLLSGFLRSGRTLLQFDVNLSKKVMPLKIDITEPSKASKSFVFTCVGIYYYVYFDDPPIQILALILGSVGFMFALSSISNERDKRRIFCYLLLIFFGIVVISRIRLYYEWLIYMGLV